MSYVELSGRSELLSARRKTVGELDPIGWYNGKATQRPSVSCRSPTGRTALLMSSSVALHYPYVLAFDPTFVEVRHVDSGALMQIIPGISLRLLFADTPPSSSAALTAAQNNPNYPYPYNPHSVRQSSYGQHSQYSPPVRLPGPRKQVIYTSGKHA